ncbi:MAG: hypothetical protein M5U19_08825 [Microthrixaceae bacterium]|nr:hypothetical protein [Microthrixaceae bacterium]
MKVLAAYLHVLGVATYLGGSIIMEFVVGPAQKGHPAGPGAGDGQEDRGPVPGVRVEARSR